MEVNEGMVDHLRRSRPWLEVISGDAGDLGKLLREAGLSQADAIVSSLPWTLFEEAQQKRVLEEIAASIVPGGSFSTITTLTVMPFQRFRNFRGLMNSTFATVATLGPIWRNIPPALVYAGVVADDRLAGEVAGGWAADGRPAGDTGGE